MTFTDEIDAGSLLRGMYASARNSLWVARKLLLLRNAFLISQRAGPGSRFGGAVVKVRAADNSGQNFPLR